VSAEDERRARAEARGRRVHLRWTKLGDEDPTADAIFGADAVTLVTELTEQVWSLSRRPLPSYTRATIPIRFVPGRER
jgi:hypothetical protein